MMGAIKSLDKQLDSLMFWYKLRCVVWLGNQSNWQELGPDRTVAVPCLLANAFRQLKLDLQVVACWGKEKRYFPFSLFLSFSFVLHPFQSPYEDGPPCSIKRSYMHKGIGPGLKQQEREAFLLLMNHIAISKN